MKRKHNPLKKVCPVMREDCVGSDCQFSCMIADHNEDGSPVYEESCELKILASLAIAKLGGFSIDE